LAAAGAGGLIWAFGWEWADPVASILISMLVIYSSWALIKEAVAILMESTPTHLDIEAVRAALAGGPGVREVHDLHAWTITSGMVSLSAHVIVTDQQSPPAALRAIREILHEKFGLDHVTIQIETEGDCACPTPSDGGCVTSPSASQRPESQT
jgi:cobalt-zinc-cadmium efflux system protein